MYDCNAVCLPRIFVLSICTELQCYSKPNIKLLLPVFLEAQIVIF
jgi:hypothetical protein